MEHAQPEPPQPELLEEYVPGTANGLNYMAKLCHFADGPWHIEVVHVEGQAPLTDTDRSWPTREQAAQAAAKMVADLAP